MTDQLLTRLQRRLDACALCQLRAEAARLATENEALRARVAYLEDNAEFWSREATDMHLQLCEVRGARPAIDQTGRLVVS